MPGRIALIALPIFICFRSWQSMAWMSLTGTTLLPLVLNAQQNAVAHGNLRVEMFFSVFLTFLVSGIQWIIICQTVTRSLTKRRLHHPGQL